MNHKTNKTKKICIVVGEASGDLIGQRLIKALVSLSKKQNMKLDLMGIGGPLMKKEGFVPLFDMQHITAFGFFEVFKKIPQILVRMNEIKRQISQEKPEILITIDAPDFNFRLGKWVKAHHPEIKIVHMNAPTVWAWRPGRAKKIALFLDLLLTLFPFEPPYFTKWGLESVFIGHPVLEYQIDQINPDFFRKKHQITQEQKILLFLPGSRVSEVKSLGHLFVQAIKDYCASHPQEAKNLVVVMPSLSYLRPYVEEFQTLLPMKTIAFYDQLEEKYEAFRAADMALCASGTITLELACAGVPHVIAYKLQWLSAFLAPYFVKLRFVNLINIMFNREVIPEYILNNCTLENLTHALAYLNSPQSQEQKKELKDVLQMLKVGNQTPSDMAASQILAMSGE